jgi:hypothetical protein
VQHEGPAAYARGLRFDERQDELHRDRGIDGTATVSQNSNAGLGRVGVRRNDHLLGSVYRLVGKGMDACKQTSGKA